MKQKGLAKQERHIPFGVVQRQIGKYLMQLRSDGGIQSYLMKLKGEREPELLYVLRREIKKGTICLDLGANIGYVTLLMADRVGPKGRVFAIEPDPANIEILKANLEINGFSDRVQVNSMGISNKRGEMSFYLGKSSNLGGMAKTKNTTGESIKVKVDTLTNFCMKNDFPRLVKMDIEGHEVEVLEGMYELVKRTFPCKIIMELHPIHYSVKHSLEYWMKKFLKQGFKTKYVISAGVIEPDLFKKWGYKPIESFASKRGLYDGFSERHMLKACCFTNKQWMPHKKKFSPKIARYVMIERE